MAAGFQLDVATINSQIGADGQYMKQFYFWLKGRYATWNQNVSAAILEATPLLYSTADANTIMTVIADMNRLIQMFEGTVTGASTENIAGFDVNAVLGCN